MKTLLRTSSALLLFLLLRSPLSAQITLTGRVLDAATGSVIPASFVRLVDASGIRVADVLTGDAGRFALSAPRGRYVLRVERLGYKTYESPSFQLDSATVRDLRIPADAISLPSITAKVSSKCFKDVASAEATTVLWEEVRKALTITSWTAQNGQVFFQMLSTTQQLDPVRLTVRSENVDIATSTLSGSPYAAFEKDSLLMKGFVQPGENGYPSYYGPDAELILSKAFQQSHCFHPVIDRKKPGLVGLSFEPIGAIKGSDIRGTLWIDRQSYQLKKLDFSYDKLPVNAPLSTAGGDVVFTRLPTGMWIVSSWMIMAPIMSDQTKPVILDSKQSTSPPRKSNGVLIALNRTINKVMSAYSGDKPIYQAIDGERDR